MACFVQYTFRVGCPCCLFQEGQRRPECGVSQCGNPRFLWLSITKLLQKSEMRKDIVIELSYKGFS